MDGGVEEEEENVEKERAETRVVRVGDAREEVGRLAREWTGGPCGRRRVRDGNAVQMDRRRKQTVMHTEGGVWRW
jgi:hypothetical protein